MHPWLRSHLLGAILLLAPALAGGQPTVQSPNVRLLLKEMSVERQVAQLVMPWLLGNYAAFDADGLAQARAWVDSIQVGGIVISIGSPLDVAAKLNFLQRRARIPLLISADLEGGAAFRFTGATPFPTNMGVGASGREQDAYQMGRITALEGRAIGVHLVFAPVADVNNNPANPIINTRSFGADPLAVARLVGATVRGTRAGGMLATAKHFPGHGDTETDSHISLPVIRADWSRLDRLELVPFRAAIEAGVEAVMSGHVALPWLIGDSSRPATLAPEILTTLLRDSLGFHGLVVTDALDMGALVARYGGGEAAVRAFEAGSDLLLMPASPADAVRAMVAAVESGRISRTRLRSSVARILMVKERLGLFRRRTVRLERIPAVVGRKAFADTARAIAARSMVLVRDSGVVVRLRSAPAQVTVVSYGEPGASSAFPWHLTRRGHRVTSVRLHPASGPASYDSARTALRRSPIAIFGVAVKVVSGSGSIAMPEALAALIEETSRAQPTILVSFGSPYLLSQSPSPEAVLLAWTANPLTDEAAALALTGSAVTGRLPIDLPPHYRIGDGLGLPSTEARAISSRR